MVGFPLYIWKELGLNLGPQSMQATGQPTGLWLLEQLKIHLASSTLLASGTVRCHFFSNLHTMKSGARILKVKSEYAVKELTCRLDDFLPNNLFHCKSSWIKHYEYNCTDEGRLGLIGLSSTLKRTPPALLSNTLLELYVWVRDINFGFL